MKNKIHIGLLGFGTVGAGVAKLLMNNKDIIYQRSGLDIVLSKVADIDTATDRGITLAPGILTNDAHGVVKDPDIDIIVEMIGGETIAGELILAAIDHGKPVVTANKALLAAQGNTLFRYAGEKNVDLAYEASTGGCMPIIKTIRESLVGNRIHAMTGILNGTCNYILTRIFEDNISFSEALRLAQEIGYAEADPTLDVEGLDTAHKLTILSAIAYGMTLNLSDVYVEGISGITPLDIRFADQFGYKIKLLAISKFLNGKVEARVHPTMIPSDTMLAGVSGSLNAVGIIGDAVEDILLYGRGAGMMPTASAVVGDIVDIARDLCQGCSCRVPALSFQPERIRPVPVMPIEEIKTHYYFRFSLQDKPGVLSRISGILGDHDISIKTVQQHGRKSGGTVPVVIMSYLASEKDVRAALTDIETLDVVDETPVLIRIEDTKLAD